MNRSPIHRTLTLVLSIAIGLAALALTAGPVLARPASPTPAQLPNIRAATARYHDVSVALADGYIPVSGCEQSPQGTMGIHYLNPELAADAIVDPARPESLLYLPGEGTTRLVGVEYFVAAAATGGVGPEVHGAPFDGPMAGHNDQMPEHYDLHLWIWSHNLDGLTAPWNPCQRT
jgi:hypothetical protein